MMVWPGIGIIKDLILLGCQRYGILWKHRNSDEWKLWFTEECPTSPVSFQWASSTDRRLPSAEKYIRENIGRNLLEIETRIVILDFKVYELINENGIDKKGKEL